MNAQIDFNTNRASIEIQFRGIIFNSTLITKYVGLVSWSLCTFFLAKKSDFFKF